MFRNPFIDAGVVLLAILLIFGPKRLPQLGRSLGQGMREFKDGITGRSKVAEEEGDERPELARPSTEAAPGVSGTGATSERESAEVGSSEPRS